MTIVIRTLTDEHDAHTTYVHTWHKLDPATGMERVDAFCRTCGRELVRDVEYAVTVEVAHGV